MASYFIKLWYRTDTCHIDFIAGFSSFEDFQEQSENSFNKSIEKIYDYMKSIRPDIEFSDIIEPDFVEYDIEEVKGVLKYCDLS